MLTCADGNSRTLLAEVQTLKEANETLRREAQGYQEAIRALRTESEYLRRDVPGHQEAIRALRTEADTLRGIREEWEMATRDREEA